MKSTRCYGRLVSLKNYKYATLNSLLVPISELCETSEVVGVLLAALLNGMYAVRCASKRSAERLGWQNSSDVKGGLWLNGIVAQSFKWGELRNGVSERVVRLFMPMVND